MAHGLDGVRDVLQGKQSPSIFAKYASRFPRGIPLVCHLVHVSFTFTLSAVIANDSTHALHHGLIALLLQVTDVEFSQNCPAAGNRHYNAGLFSQQWLHQQSFQDILMQLPVSR